MSKQKLSLYQCHKRVRAVKIKDIDYIPGSSGSLITPDDPKISAFNVSSAYRDKHHPQIGGYYVLYEDGYESYSPAKAFEEGYTLVDPA